MGKTSNAENGLAENGWLTVEQLLWTSLAKFLLHVFRLFTWYIISNSMESIKVFYQFRHSGLKEGLFTCTEMFGAIFLRIIGVDLVVIWCSLQIYECANPMQIWCLH